MKQIHEKLFIITRRDLSYAQKAVQSAHAAINFIFEHPSRAGPWFNNSNYLVLLEVNDEKELIKIIEKCIHKQLCFTIFQEPDLNNQITAIAIEPGKESQKLVAKLSLLEKNEK